MSQQYVGNYSQNLFNAAKRYKLNAGTNNGFGIDGGFNKNRPLCDSEVDEIQMASDSFIRQLIAANYPTGSSTNNGFQIVQSSLNISNNFTIKGGDGTVNGAGILFVDGYILFLKSDIEYTSQNSSSADPTNDSYTNSVIPALTTPIAPRTDEVYIDFYFAEVSARVSNPISEYTDLAIQVTGKAPTANRLRMVQDVRIAEGGITPTNGLDVNGIYHRYIKIATLNRLNSANITTAMITDNRILINPSLPVLTNNRILYGNYQQSPTFVYTGSGVGIGLTNPVTALDIIGREYVSVNIGIGTTNAQAALHVEGDIVGKSNGTSNLGSTTRRYANIYLASTLDYTNDLVFNSTTEKMRMTTSGKLGIGTNNPQYQLDIFSATNQSYLAISAPNASGAGSQSILKLRVNTSNPGSQIDWGLFANGSDGSFAIGIGTNGLVNKMTITSIGNVGIGATSPSYLLEIGNVTSTNSTTIMLRNNGSSDLAVLFAPNNKITRHLGVDITANNFFMGRDSVNTDLVINTSGYIGLGTTNPQAVLHVEGDIVPSSSGLDSLGSATRRYANVYMASTLDYASDLRFVSGTEKVRITTSGKLGIGTNSPFTSLDVIGNQYISGNIGIGSTNPQAKLHIEGDIVPSSSNTNNLGSSSRRFANVYMASNVDYSNNLTFTNSSSIKMSLTTTGRLGIGSTNPSKTLYVAGDTIIDGIVGIGSNLTIGGNLAVAGTTTTVNSNVTTVDVFSVSQSANDHAVTVFQTNNLATSPVVGIFNAGTGSALTIDNGNVGLGTTSPFANLEVSSPSNTYIRISADNDNNNSDNDPVLQFYDDNIWQASIQVDNNQNNILAFRRSSSTVNDMVIDSSGRVGIGSTTPGQALDVTGNIRASSLVTTSGIKIVTTNTTGICTNMPTAVNTLVLCTDANNVGTAQLTDTYVSSSAAIAWSKISKSSSNLTDLTTYTHNSLQSIQGGTSGDYQHLTTTQVGYVNAAVTTYNNPLSISGHTISLNYNSSLALTGTGNTTLYVVDQWSTPIGTVQTNLTNHQNLTTSAHGGIVASSGSITQIATRNHSDLQNLNSDTNNYHIPSSKIHVPLSVSGGMLSVSGTDNQTVAVKYDSISLGLNGSGIYVVDDGHKHDNRYYTQTQLVNSTLSLNLAGLSVSGTIGGNINGNAATVNNGVYTNGSYSNPSWLTQISGNIVSGGTVTASLTGNVNGNCSGNSGSVTNGVYTTGSYSNPSWLPTVSYAVSAGYASSAGYAGYIYPNVSDPGWLTSLASNKLGPPIHVFGYTDAGSVGIGGDPNWDKFMIFNGNFRMCLSSPDVYPQFQVYNNSHDNVSLNFDSCYDTSSVNWISSVNSGSNFRIIKRNNSLRISYASGYGQGATITPWASSPDNNVALTVTSTGSIGIGTTNPADILGIYNGHFRMQTTQDAYSQFQFFNFSHDNVSLNFDSWYDGSWKSSVSSSGSNFRIYKTNNALNFHYASGFSAGTTIDTWANATTNIALKVAIVGIGNTTATCQIVIPYLGGTGNRAVYSDANGALTNTSSDISLKKNIININNCLEKNNQLRPVYYNWIDIKRGEQIEVGLIAQEVEKIVPEVIGKNSDGLLSLDYAKLTAILIGAVKELTEKLDTQDIEIKELDSKNKALLTRLDDLENKLNMLL
jgi:hypothetical protein